jgi:uncharacterized OB-fold protein
MTTAKPLPDIGNPQTMPFWNALRERRIIVQRCSSCATARYPASPICPSCLSREHTWDDIEQDGELWSYVVYRRALAPAFADDVPYVIGIVEVADSLHITARIDASLDSLVVGMRVRAVFTDVSDALTLLSFAPAGGAQNA